MAKNRQVIRLIGAGLNGPLLALGLVKRGFDVEIYERRPDMRRVRMSAGRSINLALSTRGIHSLTEAGLWQEMQNIITSVSGRMIHSLSGGLTFQQYGKDDTEVIHSISRADLNIALMDVAEAHRVRINFDQRCMGIDLRSGELQLRDESSGKEYSLNADTVIGCDGSASAIRSRMMSLPRFNFSQEYLNYGYKELTIPARDGKHAIEAHALHIWPRGNFMLIALPNVDGTFACILFLPFEGSDGFERLGSGDLIHDFFKSNFPDALSLMPDLTDNFLANSTGSMVTIKCAPWHVNGRALLLGDAAHAIVPFFGQGINCGFEDCSVLLELLDRVGPDWERVFSEFEQARKVNTDAIADLAVENFVEMRDRVADPRFLFRKKVELALQQRYPQRFVPKYAMVTFRRVPYSTALQRGRVQDEILSQLCECIQSVEELDWNTAEALINSQLNPLELS